MLLELLVKRRQLPCQGFGKLPPSAGSTLTSSVRRKPNAFNLLHQMKMLERMRKVDEVEEAQGRSQ